ncbi:MAG: hypothetical protein ACRDP3_19840, partial [Streptomyces sp.]|uniref:hypothetical protein n=1 Tax=Streptomyces sp. TaxID=1931 RepID=UPI003D6B426F
MHGRHEHDTIDALLNQAEVFAEDYEDRDAAAAREAELAAFIDTPPGSPSAPAARARQYPTDGEQAAHDLDLAVALVVNAPEAAVSLSRLVDDQEHIAPEGALVFGCLLHLVGYREAAQFWWQFAAGGGSRTAAFCLCLHHRRHGEFRDAGYWRAQSERLAQHRPPSDGGPRPSARRHGTNRP